MHYTYLISDGSGRTKIGHSNTPKRRLSGLQSSTADRLEIVHTWVGSRPRQMWLEKRLHHVLARGRVKGEWFRTKPEHIRHIGDLLVAGDEDTAVAIADALADAALHWDTYERADALRQNAHPRWRADRRAEAEEVMERAWSAHQAAEARAVSLGLPADDWTFNAEAFEALRPKRAAAKPAPVLGTPSRKMSKTLQRYLEARGLPL